MVLSLDTIGKIEFPVSTGWLIGLCMEFKGKQELWIKQKPEILNALQEQAIIQSSESSNRIEGVTVASERLRPIILGRSRPRDRSEEEVVGYRKALNWIFTRKTGLGVTPDVVLYLHNLAQSGFSGDAGQWKQKDNEIIEIMPDGERRVRFKPTPAGDTPSAMNRLCSVYGDLVEQERIPVLIIIATYVFDFLCIHPFRDGNGRVSRLLTTFLLQQNRFEMGRYISLERLVEESKEDYYDILARCSQGWQEGTNDLAPWWNYFLSIIKLAYQEFARRVETADVRSGKSAIVRRMIDEQLHPFTLGQLILKCPSVSVQLIKKILNQMKNEGKIKLSGRGRGARWEKINE